jgi:hypothetical protein
MRKRVCAAAVALMASALPIGLGATPTLAATTTTWTVTPGGTFSGATGQITLWDSVTNYQMGCTSGQLAGTLKSGSGLNGYGIGTITSMTLCSTSETTPWPLIAKAYNPHSVGGATTVNIKKIHFASSASGCSFVVDGTSDTADDGSIRLKYYNNTHRLHTVSNGSTLHFYDVSGCDGLIHSGDAMFIVVYYEISPAQTISSP